MIEKSLFSFKEITEFIMAFYNCLGGCWEFDLRQIPNIRKFIGLGFAEKSKKYDGLYVLSESGKAELDRYVKDMVKLFVDYMQIHNCEQPLENVILWFKEQWQLDTLDDASYILEYISMRLKDYGYEVTKPFSPKRGNLCYLEKIK